MTQQKGRSPVVASDIDGLREVVEHGKTEYLFLSGDTRTLARYIKELIFNPKRCIFIETQDVKE